MALQPTGLMSQLNEAKPSEPYLDDMVSKGLLITQSHLKRAEGHLELGPLLKQYL